MSQPAAPDAQADLARPGRAITAPALLAQVAALWRHHGSGMLAAALLVQAARAMLWRWLPEASTGEFVRLWVANVFDLALQLLAGAALAWVVQQRGGNARGRAASVLLSALGTSLLCSLQICVLLLALVVPGLLRLTQLFVALPLLVIEGDSGTVSMRRSEALTRGSRWLILFTFVVVRGLYLLGEWLLGCSEAPIVSLPTSVNETKSWLLDLGSLALTGTAMVTCCQLLRAHHAPPDPRRLATVFD